MKSDVSNPTQLDETREGTTLLILLVGNLVLGFGFLLFLLALPSDAGSAVIGRYSRERVLLLGGILVATMLLAGFGLVLLMNRRLRARLGAGVLGRRGWARRIFPVALALLALLCLIARLFFAAELQALTKYHYARLAPYLLWPLVFIASLAVAQQVVWASPRLQLAPKAAERSAVVCLFVLTFLARASLSGYGLPYQSVWDEVTTYPRALEILSGDVMPESDIVPGYGRASYGDPVIYLTAAGQIAGLFSLLRTGAVFSVSQYVAPADGVGTVFEAVHDSGVPLQYPRLLFALVNSLTPVLIYLALRRYLEAGLWASIAGSLIYALFSPDVIYFSAFIYPDALATLFVTGAAIAGLEVIRSGTDTWKPALACGVLIGLAMSITVRYAGMIPVPFIALGLAHERKNWVERFALMAVGMALAFAVASPAFVLDLPTYLGRLTGLSWEGDGSLVNRVFSLRFYFQEAFLGQGLGAIVLGLTLVGSAATVRHKPRMALFLASIVVLHMLVITTTVYRYSRHALVLYPIFAILAGQGLDLAQSRVAGTLTQLQAKAGMKKALGRVSPGAVGPIVFVSFLVLSAPKLVQAATYVDVMRSFETSQARMAEYMSATLDNDARVGLLEIVPFRLADRRRSRADIEEVGLSTTLDELRDMGVEYVIGTNRIGGDFGDTQGTIWVSGILDHQAPLAEFGSSEFAFRGWPVGDIYLYLARVPPIMSESSAR